MDKLYLQAKLFLWKCAQLFEISVKSMIQYSSLEKLHVIILNYVLNYTLHPKLFEYIVYTLNYDIC